MSYDDLDHIPFDNPRRKPILHTGGDEYTFDAYGSRIYAGDYVRCERGTYLGLRLGEQRRVIKISNDTLIMRNGYSPTSERTSAYQPRNFKLAGRHHAWHKTEEAKMAKNTLYIAVNLVGRDYQTVAEHINTLRNHDASTRADTSFESLKAWINMRIRHNPDERWLILSGTTLAETSAPPVSFRSV